MESLTGRFGPGSEGPHAAPAAGTPGLLSTYIASCTGRFTELWAICLTPIKVCQ